MTESNILTRIRADLNSARKKRDRLRTDTLGMLLSEAQNRKIEAGKDLSDDDVLGLLTTAVKRRREAADQMRGGGREELAEREEAEAELLQGYLPAQLSEAEVRSLVQDAIAGGATNIGAVMKVVMPETRGRFDGKELSRVVREELAG